MDYTIEKMISEGDLQARIREVAKEIEKDYEGKDLICVGLLKGSIMFMADLLKNVELDLAMDFMKVSSYHGGTDSTGVVKILKDVDEDLTGKDVLIIEDIIDTGLTLESVKKFLMSKQPKSLKVCSLLDKPSRRKVEMVGEYIGFEIPDEFVVGYGLDYDELYRNLPYIGKVVRK
ncbi:MULTISPECIES: hypoxanthine phosphoribosyltransferase [Cetobacterium]|jgi:hypoxanthine phosphoribosyltransferase|uniref:Hypoxanthine phosphoribosyltransferase n=1 Tax=Cetobacterium somerae ATCC BAA-474 TaxID=1319815 RepID=U7VEA8_9FUSO|nr:MULTISPECIES: hypoxanthine phosphoribosyltransferase [Cetobacterium]ERT69831.1 hypoxanthine phosphoribosyltransferase [Cetobacterium somerae ATCC BAA-474]MBC2853282.1 hypoxanthine phosphoribosyltransferase [Cetobacterium sp. 2G large]MCQ9625675.1 hypoxanthine phosphoribosyltransferase [Cetobacterium somerae]MCX3066218.1 hypoxanthine phosphoribosyltransferase [Cetobacterium somerae]UPO96697.1 hypoxanthine phosphoribosyltransferase [Cetobacterium somerae]